MKRLLRLLLTICIIWTLTSCGNGSESTPIEVVPSIVPPVEIEQEEETNLQEEISETSDEPFEGKIAIITLLPEHGWGDFEIARQIVEKYGEDKIVHRTWPVLFMVEPPETMIKIIEELGNDPDIKAIIVSYISANADEAFERLRETRGDIFVSCLNIFNHDLDTDDVLQFADLILMTDEAGMDFSIAQQAQRLGASTVVFYEFPRQNPWPFLPEKRERIEWKSDEIGIQFAEYVVGEMRDIANNPLILEGFINDFAKIVEKHGKDAAIFSANIPAHNLLHLINAVAETDVILIYPVYHFIAASLGVIPNFHFYDISPPTKEDIYKIRAILAEKNATGRISTWSVPASWVNIYASVQYAIKWINGEVPQDSIDVDVLRQLMEDFALVDVTLTPFVEGETGQTFDNFFMVLMDFITF